MIDIIITLILLVATFILSLVLDIQNEALASIINTIPLLIITIRLWYNYPKNYFKFMSFINRNIKYKINIKLDDCDINRSFYDLLCEDLKKIYGKSAGKIINKDIGTLQWKSFLSINASIVEVTYNTEQYFINIEMESKTKLRYFIEDAQQLLSTISRNFSKCECKHSNETIFIYIKFICKNQNEIKNPFVDKYYSKFNDVIFRMKYRAKHGSKFEITDYGINISGEKLDNVKKDLKNEMLLF